MNMAQNEKATVDFHEVLLAPSWRMARACYDGASVWEDRSICAAQPDQMVFLPCWGSRLLSFL